MRGIAPHNIPLPTFVYTRILFGGMGLGGRAKSHDDFTLEQKARFRRTMREKFGMGAPAEEEVPGTWLAQLTPSPGRVVSMQASSMAKALAAIVFAATLPLMACGDDSPTSPTSTTQSGPTVIGATMTLQGVINRMSRSGANGEVVDFRIGDEPFVRGDAATTVLDGSVTGNTSHLRDGQRVTVDAVVRRDYIYARHVVINSR